MINRLALLLALWLGLLAPANAVVSGTNVGDAAYTVTANDTFLVTTTAFTAPRIWTLPSAGATNIGSAPPATGRGGTVALQIVDLAGAVSGTNTLTITPASGETINGSTGSYVVNYARARLILIPLSGSAWALFPDNVPGALAGTATNDNATAGNVGEILSTSCPGTATTATITVTIAAPGVVTYTAHGFLGACPVVFTTSGALPTGITSGTTYYIVPSSITTNTFTIATTIANALVGTAITTSGSQSGTQTATAGVALTSTTAADVTGLALTAGDWDCRAKVAHNLGASTSVTILSGSISATTATAGTRGTNNETLLATAANVMGVNGTDLGVGPHRVSLAATTNYFLVAQDTFSVSTDVGYGTLTCRRAR